VAAATDDNICNKQQQQQQQRQQALACAGAVESAAAPTVLQCCEDMKQLEHVCGRLGITFIDCMYKHPEQRWLPDSSTCDVHWPLYEGRTSVQARFRLVVYCIVYNSKKATGGLTKSEAPACRSSSRVCLTFRSDPGNVCTGPCNSPPVVNVSDLCLGDSLGTMRGGSSKKDAY
jgi:hypothetical protein